MGSGFAGGSGRFSDGPCNSIACEWPIGYVSPDRQPIPATPIVDAGKMALSSRIASRRTTFLTDIGT
jgi:hypothetical protein